MVGQNYGYPTGTPGQGPTLPGNIDFVVEALTFAKNLELTDDIVKGQTFIGFLSPLRFRYRVADEVTIEAGAILGHNFGDDNGLDVADPLLRLVYQPDPCDTIVGGTLLDTHWIANALFDDTWEFRRPAEEGFQDRVDRSWLKNDAWIDWRTREEDDRPEQFNVADSTQFRIGGLWLDGQFLWRTKAGRRTRSIVWTTTARVSPAVLMESRPHPWPTANCDSGPTTCRASRTTTNRALPPRAAKAMNSACGTTCIPRRRACCVCTAVPTKATTSSPCSAIRCTAETLMRSSDSTW